jgi:polar amino acid transport system substrate-binding protein
MTPSLSTPGLAHPGRDALSALRRRTPARRALLAAGVLLPALPLAACADPGSTATGAAGSDGGGSDPSDGGGEGRSLDTSGTQERITTAADDSLTALLPDEIRSAGSLRVGVSNGGSPPLGFLADDNETMIGSEIDIPYLVADKLGLEVELKLTAWEDWPLKLGSGELDVVHENVGINPERLKTFDFASYRAAYMAFLAKKDADFHLEDVDSISGHLIAVGNGTNQENILLAWNTQLEKQGKEPAELKNYSSEADVILALVAGRIDAYFAPNASTSYIATTRDDVELQGRVDAGWPDQTLVAATFPRGSGLAEAYAKALQATIEDGTYRKVLERWGPGRRSRHHIPSPHQGEAMTITPPVLTVDLPTTPLLPADLPALAVGLEAAGVGALSLSGDAEAGDLHPVHVAAAPGPADHLGQPAGPDRRRGRRALPPGHTAGEPGPRLRRPVRLVGPGPYRRGRR